MGNVLFTIGHATRSLESFAELLKHAGVQCVIDVRTVPRSRTNPQFDRDVLAQSLGPFGIEYRHLPELGGLRGKQKNVPEATNAYWENQSFHNYADYAMSAEFGSGLRELRKLGAAKACAVMCAETLWWRCHRRIIGDYLITAGDAVFHILGPGKIAQARITEAVTRGRGGVLTYPAKN